MAKNQTILGDIRRNEHYESLMKLPARDLCEMIRAHFESHPTLPGEKDMKDRVNSMLNNAKDLNMTDIDITDEEKQALAREYAQTRIRETPIKDGNYYLDFRTWGSDNLKREPVEMANESDRNMQPDKANLYTDSRNNPVYVSKTNVKLQKSPDSVYVLAEMDVPGYNGTPGVGWRTIGTLPDNFLTNNPMNVDECNAEMVLTDYSNGKLKNISVRVVVDTDLMSGDVIDLDEDMFDGIDKAQENDRCQ